MEKQQLFLGFHGRIIDQLGIQMYQSPVAAIAEMVSNAWDADAEKVEITLPVLDSVDADRTFIVSDTGQGMTFEQCQSRFLAAGYDTRKGDPSAKSPNNRVLLGRKGIGKFAGFGLAKSMTVDTISKSTGEHTVFCLNLDAIRGNGQDFVSTNAIPVEVLINEGPDAERAKQHGTTITLANLTISKAPSPSEFRKSMARRFSIHQEADSFSVIVDGEAIPEDDELGNVRYSFPTAYPAGKAPAGMRIEDEWGIETVDGHEIKWRFRFLNDPIDEEELRGITVFAEKKLAQKPFFFNITGGVWGQGGLEYMTGKVVANYLDHFEDDIIAAERQRVNWEDSRAINLLEWGQKRVKELAGIWSELRRDAKINELEGKVAGFSSRLEKFPPHERAVVKNALTKLANVARISEQTYVSLSNAVLTAWEKGRLKELIYNLSQVGESSPDEVLGLLVEADVLTALNVAESVKTRLDSIQGLKYRIETRELENSIRDYIAEHPWLLSPDWEKFEKELSVKNLIDRAAEDSRLATDPDFQKRVDLVLSSGTQLILIEFMRPGLRLDLDHLNRFEYYILTLRRSLQANTGGRFETVTGLLVADGVERNGAFVDKLDMLSNYGMEAIEWGELLARSERQWRDFLFALKVRTPVDARMDSLLEETGVPVEADGLDGAAVTPESDAPVDLLAPIEAVQIEPEANNDGQ